MRKDISKTIDVEEVLKYIYKDEFSILVSMNKGWGQPDIALIFTQKGAPLFCNYENWNKEVIKALSLRGLNINMKNINVDIVSTVDDYDPGMSF